MGDIFIPGSNATEILCSAHWGSGETWWQEGKQAKGQLQDKGSEIIQHGISDI